MIPNTENNVTNNVMNVSFVVSLCCNVYPLTSVLNTNDTPPVWLNALLVPTTDPSRGTELKIHYFLPFTTLYSGSWCSSLNLDSYLINIDKESSTRCLTSPTRREINFHWVDRSLSLSLVNVLCSSLWHSMPILDCIRNFGKSSCLNSWTLQWMNSLMIPLEFHSIESYTFGSVMIY